MSTGKFKSQSTAARWIMSFSLLDEGVCFILSWNKQLLCLLCNFFSLRALLTVLKATGLCSLPNRKYFFQPIRSD